MKTQLTKLSRTKARYTEEYKQEALELWRVLFPGRAPSRNGKAKERGGKQKAFPNTRWKRRARRASRTPRCIRPAGSRPVR